MYVLTSSPYVSNLFAKQKSELNFDSNEDFILFLLRNTCKLASFGKKIILNLISNYKVFSKDHISQYLIDPPPLWLI